MHPTKKTSGAIPTKIVKLANKQICKDLENCINECMKQNKFPNELKIACITPTFKKEDPLDKTDYVHKHTTNCFKNFRKNVIQLQHFANNFFSPLLWGFRK